MTSAWSLLTVYDLSQYIQKSKSRNRIGQFLGISINSLIDFTTHYVIITLMYLMILYFNKSYYYLIT